MSRRPASTEGIDWEATTWEGSRRRQLERWADLTLEEILDAQEAMAELAQEILDAPSGGRQGVVGIPRMGRTKKFT
jgi:hypothetical protein